jgi:hypothetical protein
MAEANEGGGAGGGGARVESPPAVPNGARVEDGPRVRLHQLADVLARGTDRRLLAEYLRLRRACR